MKTVSVLRQFILGLRHYAGAFSFIRQNGLRHWYGIALDWYVGHNAGRS